MQTLIRTGMKGLWVGPFMRLRDGATEEAPGTGTGMPPADPAIAAAAAAAVEPARVAWAVSAMVMTH